MYPAEITNQFIELRSRDISLERIAQQLGINKSTAIDWQRRYQARIDEFKAIHLDAVRERLTTKYEDELEYAMSELKRIRAELKTRDWDYEATTFLHHAEAAAYRRVQKLCALADFPRSGRDAAPPTSANASPLPPVPETKSLGRSNDPELGQDEAQTGNPTSANPQPSSLNAFSPPSLLPSSEVPGNPSRIQPFPHHNEGGSTSEPRLDHNHDLSLNPTDDPQPEIESDGESIPFGPYESTREWLERQGIQVSKTPKQT